jgi:hypothetical protein
MNRIFIAAAAVLAFSSAANAEGVSVKVSGKTPEVLHHDIHLAAKKACEAELTGAFDHFYLNDYCVADAEARANAQVGAAASATAQGHGASATGR